VAPASAQSGHRIPMPLEQRSFKDLPDGTLRMGPPGGVIYSLLPGPCSYCTDSARQTAPAQLESDDVAYVIAVPFVEYAAITIV